MLILPTANRPWTRYVYFRHRRTAATAFGSLRGRLVRLRDDQRRPIDGRGHASDVVFETFGRRANGRRRIAGHRNGRTV